jgi:hypothetical protein
MTGAGGRVDPSRLHLLPPPVLSSLLHGIASALSHVFVWAIPFAALVAALAVFVKEEPLRGSPTGEAAPGRAGDAQPSKGDSAGEPSGLVGALE